jgi:hypothetical protein
VFLSIIQKPPYTKSQLLRANMISVYGLLKRAARGATRVEVREEAEGDIGRAHEQEGFFGNFLRLPR